MPVTTSPTRDENFLEDDLLGRLRRDAPELFLALRELDLVLELDAGGVLLAVHPIDVLRVTQRDLGGRVLDRLDDLLHGEELDVSRLVVQARLEVLAVLAIGLARGRQNGFLDGRDDDGRIDASLLGQRLDRLHERVGTHCV
jgi:hypothetical protein